MPERIGPVEAVCAPTAPFPVGRRLLAGSGLPAWITPKPRNIFFGPPFLPHAFPRIFEDGGLCLRIVENFIVQGSVLPVAVVVEIEEFAGFRWNLVAFCGTFPVFR